MWILLGYALCWLARSLGCSNLYHQYRHSFRSNRSQLFLGYWQYFRKEAIA
jgi:hypothetical protein